MQTSLTESDELVPSEFIDFNNTLPNVNVKQGSYEATEVFADTFAIAVMRGTELNSCNPFPFPDSINKLFTKTAQSIL